MDRRIAFWMSAMYGSLALGLQQGDRKAAYFSQKAFIQEIAFREMYDRAFAYQHN